MAGLRAEDVTIHATFKSNMWYRMNVLGEKQVSGNRNWVTNGNLAYPLEKSLWSSYYKGTVREVVDISTEAPPFKNALHIKQTTSGVAGIIDAVIWEGASANVLAGQNISMATWLKYQNVSNESLVMQVQVTGKTSSGLFSYDYPKVFSYTGTDLTWKRQTGTVKINLPDGAVEITRVAFRLGLAGVGTGEFWATGIQLETGNALGDWSTNPNDTEEELNKTEARFILTEKEVGLSVKKGELINGVLVNSDGVKIDGRNVDINGLVNFSSFDTTTKTAIDAKSTKTEAQGYATTAQNASKSYTDTEAGKIKTTVTAVSDIANSLKNFTDTAFSDGIIQRAEAQAISEHLNTLKKENDDLGNQYNVVYANANLTGTPKTNLASAKTAYNTAYTNLVTSINTAITGDKTTPAQKTDVDTKYTAYSTALKLLTQRLTESQTAVSEKIANDLAVAKANLAEVNAKAHADGKVTAEETRAIADAKAKLSEAQGYADSAVNNLEIGGRNYVLDSKSTISIKGQNIFNQTLASKYFSGGTFNGANLTEKTITVSVKWKAIGTGFSGNWRIQGNNPYPALSDVIQISSSNTSGIAIWTNKVSTSIGSFNRFNIRLDDVPSTVTIEFYEFKVEIGNKATDWSPAPEDVDAMIAQAQTDATNAKNSASTANQLLADLSNDNILTPVEKKSIKKEWDIITGEKNKITAEATKFNIAGEQNAYITQYNKLNTYVTPLLTNLNTNSTIVATTFRANFKNYYDARQDVLNAITSKAKTLADTAQGVADTVKGVVSNFDSAIINANPIFLDWTGTYPAGYSSMTGSTFAKVVSGNGMGNAVKYTIASGVNAYFNPNQVTTSPFYNYVTIEFTFMLESGTVDGAGILFRYNGTGTTDHAIKIKDIIPSPTLNKWYTVTKVIKQASIPAGFTGYTVYLMGGFSSLGTVTAKVIQFDSLKTRQATEQEINAYESSIMITDMSSDSKITPVEKVQLKKEWATINAERTSLDGLALTYGVTTERTNMTTAYNTLNTVLNGAGGILLTMSSTSTVVATTFRAQFDDYYEKKAILQKKVNELAKSYADNATVLANNASTLAGTKSKTFTSTPTTPYVSGDVWKNGTAVYISTANRTSGAYVVTDWVLVGDVTSANTANDVTNVGGVASGTVRDRATNGNTAYSSTSLWKSTNLTTINGGQITTDTITSGAIKSDVALINKLFVSDANINVLTGKSAFINSIKAIDISAERVVSGTFNGLTFTNPYNINGLTGTTVLKGDLTSSYTKTNGQYGTMAFSRDRIFSNLYNPNGSLITGYNLSSEALNFNSPFGSATYNFDNIIVNRSDGAKSEMIYAYSGYGLQLHSDYGMKLGRLNQGKKETLIEVGTGSSPDVRFGADVNLLTHDLYEVGKIRFNAQSYITAPSADGLDLRARTFTKFTLSGWDAMFLTRDGSTGTNNMDMYGNLNMQGKIDMKTNGIANAGRINFNDQSYVDAPNADSSRLNARTYTAFTLSGWDVMYLVRDQNTGNNRMDMYGNINMNSFQLLNNSDRRLKQNIQTTKVTALDTYRKLNVVDYEWRDPRKPQGRHLGVIAQETPFWSEYDASTDIWNISSSKQIMYNSLGIKELTSIVDSHTQILQNLNLENRIKELEFKIKQLESAS